MPASDADLAAMLEALGLDTLDALFAHLPDQARFSEDARSLPPALEAGAVLAQLAGWAERNRPLPGFLGDGLPHYTTPGIVETVSGLRRLATAYTPYQPERSQGTLISLWLYQCLMRRLTGFEAINSSLYDRSSALYEALALALRHFRTPRLSLLIPAGCHASDWEVVRTLAEATQARLIRLPLDPETGATDLTVARAEAERCGDDLAAIVVPQVNHLGILEAVDALTDLAHGHGALALAIVDPLHLAAGGLKAPVAFGQNGADVVVGEAQHLALPPNFGGPGLGLFGVRHNATQSSLLRQTPGRYVGRAQDTAGQSAFTLVLSTREQHIRKERATSNICSNQAFVATLVGAALLERGDQGLAAQLETARTRAREVATGLQRCQGVRLACAGAFLDEVLVELPEPAAALIEAGRAQGLHVGVDASDRLPGGRHLLKLSCSDREQPVEALMELCTARYGLRGTLVTQDAPPPLPTPEVPQALLRTKAPGLPKVSAKRLGTYYARLGELNCSPDDAPYPLGSCTMKYNPQLNERAAALPGFTALHPQTPLADAQGALEVLATIQEQFCTLTGLAAVTTQPVAGAQGELIGLKLFQACHRARGEVQRDILLIPASAHGTNFASAVMAGFPDRAPDARRGGIVRLKAGADGGIDTADFDAALEGWGPRLAGIMITNPNTTGLFETTFARLAEAVHDAGGLVYMDGANLNAILGRCDLGALGVDAVHSNLHKTFSIPHGGGGPGDAIVAVSERLAPFLPGYQIVRSTEGPLHAERPARSIGSFHRHWGQFAHKVRACAYILRLGGDGLRQMSAVAVLSARYCLEQLRGDFAVLPAGTEAQPRMHEFILTFTDEDFERLEAAGLKRSQAIVQFGKLFLDFGYHAPTIAWPEPLGFMIEPTESFTKAELDHFCRAVKTMRALAIEHPDTLAEAPHFTPVQRIDEVAANRQPKLSEALRSLPKLPEGGRSPQELLAMDPEVVRAQLIEAHAGSLAEAGASA